MRHSLPFLVALAVSSCLFVSSGTAEALSLVRQDELPAAVKKTIERLSQGAKVGDIERENEDGHVTYELEIQSKEGEVAYELGDQGEVLEVETEISLVTLPSAVKESLRSRFQGGRLMEATWCREYFFEIEFSGDKDVEELRLRADGSPRGNECASVSPSSLPAAVRARIEGLSDVASSVEISRKPARHEEIFEIEFEREGKEIEIVMSASGDLLSRSQETSFESLSARARAAASKLGLEQAIAEVEEVTVYHYEVEIAVKGRVFEVEIGADGSIREIEREQEDNDEESSAIDRPREK